GAHLHKFVAGNVEHDVADRAVHPRKSRMVRWNVKEGVFVNTFQRAKNAVPRAFCKRPMLKFDEPGDARVHESLNFRIRSRATSADSQPRTLTCLSSNSLYTSKK